MTQPETPFILAEPERCLGCGTCEIACAAAHSETGSLLGAVLAGEKLRPRNRLLQVGPTKLPTQCRQCEEAPCARVCPTGATYRTETYTAVDPGRCVACRLCMMVCPFGAIQVVRGEFEGREKASAQKCDLCVGRSEGPACVAACPTGALALRDPAASAREAAQASARKFLEAVESRQQLLNA